MGACFDPKQKKQDRQPQNTIQKTAIKREREKKQIEMQK